jgi:hypothetical protein
MRALNKIGSRKGAKAQKCGGFPQACGGQSLRDTQWLARWMGFAPFGLRFYFFTLHSSFFTFHSSLISLADSAEMPPRMAS